MKSGQIKDATRPEEANFENPPYRQELPVLGLSQRGGPIGFVHSVVTQKQIDGVLWSHVTDIISSSQSFSSELKIIQYLPDAVIV